MPVATQRRLQPRLDFPTPRSRGFAPDLLRNGTRRLGVSHSTHSQSPIKGPWKGGALHVACTAPSQTSHNRMRPSLSPPPHSRQGSIMAVACAALSHSRPHNLIVTITKQTTHHLNPSAIRLLFRARRPMHSLSHLPSGLDTVTPHAESPSIPNVLARRRPRQIMIDDVQTLIEHAPWRQPF